MILYSQALEHLKAAASKRRSEFEAGSERVPIEQCVGRVLLDELLSPEAVPSFDNSSMDGFAVRASVTRGATLGAPIRLQIVGSIAAGGAPRTGEAAAGGAGREAAWEIMTGAPIPEGCDAVAKIEDVEVRRDASGAPLEIWLSRPLAPRENFRGRGEDFAPGQLVARAGTCLMPEHVMALASLGISEVRVLRKPKVALISTGSELVEHTRARLVPGMIRNSTAPHLVSALAAYGSDARFYGTVSDEPQEFDRLLAEILKDPPDVILTTGAVSVGKYDFVPAALERAGARTVFHKTAIRPGKPGLFGEFENGPVVFGIPGNPVSTAVALRFFVGPYLEALCSKRAERPLKARLLSPASKPEGLRCFFKARLELGSEGARVLCLGGQPSFMVSPMLESNAWVVFGEEGCSVPESSWVDVFPLHPLNYSWSGEPFSAAPSRAGGCC